MYKKVIYLLAIVSVVTIAIYINGCQQEPITPTGSENSVLNDAGNGCNQPNQFCGTPGTAYIQNSCPGTVNTIDLWAGVGNPNAGVLVGRVEFTQVSGSVYKVKYVFSDPSFQATSIHFSIKCLLSQIPHTNNGNPVPGQFEYKFDGPFGSSYEFNVTLPAGCSSFFVAAHAGGTLGGVDCFNVNIPPGCVTITNIHHDGYNGSFWVFTLNNAGTFNGTYTGWCIDLGTTNLDSTFACARVFSTLAPFPEYLKPSVEGWQNMDKLNYLINHIHVGQSIQRKDYLCNDVDGTGIINAFDYQRAIWLLTDLGPGEYPELSDSMVVNAILCDVNANGSGFVPSCANGDLILFIVDPGLNPNGTRAQPMVAAAPCCNGTTNVTAWGDGKYGGNFSGPNWATYFKWSPTCP